MDVHFFWIGRPLNALEQWCLQRYQACGFQPRLWTYHAHLDVPEGVKLEQAQHLISPDQLFLNRRGSYASFADLFRYTLLARHGGLWSDLDVVCLINATDLPTHSFLVTERDQEGGERLNNNLIFAPDAVAQSHLAALATKAGAFPRESVVWAQLGPYLLKHYVEQTPDHCFKIKPPEFANPVDWWQVPQAFQGDVLPEIAKGCAFIHLFAERWRRSGCDIDQTLEGGLRLTRWLSR